MLNQTDQPQKKVQVTGEDVSTRLYFAANKIRAMSYFVENTLMKDPTVPDDEEQVRIGLALIFTDISKEVENIGQEIEFKFPKIQ